MKIKEALEVLKKAFEKDPDYAHGWHCNIACAIMDSDVSHMNSNKAATRIMKHCFGVETSNDMLSKK